MLKRLEISALRGATRKFCLDFEADKTITIIYGENGSGKSTICDAVELLANGKIGSLEGKGLGRTEGYWHSTGAKASDMAVMLASTRGQWSAKVVRGKVMVSPNDRQRIDRVLCADGQGLFQTRGDRAGLLRGAAGGHRRQGLQQIRHVGRVNRVDHQQKK